MTAVREAFGDLRDPRVVGRCDHLLIDVLVITILAVLCGADDWPEVEEFGECREDWLKEFLELPAGIPSHDTFQRVFGALNRKQFSECLFGLTRAMQGALDGTQVAIDGKTLRASGRRTTGIPNLHLVTAWATESGLTLGQVRCEEKSSEITAIPELLRLLELKGCTATIDAMGCQTEMASQIRQQKGDYVLGLKGNQQGLEQQMQEMVEDGINCNFEAMTKTEVTTKDDDHGREVRRTCIAMEVPRDHPQRQRWKDLRSVVVITTERTVNGDSAWETRYYITGHPPRAKKPGELIRRHWSIENSQHWVLDVAFREDDRRQSSRQGTANFAAVRRLANSILRQDRTNKRGIQNKRLACGWNPSYLATVLKNAVRCADPAFEGRHISSGLYSRKGDGREGWVEIRSVSGEAIAQGAFRLTDAAPGSSSVTARTGSASLRDRGHHLLQRLFRDERSGRGTVRPEHREAWRSRPDRTNVRHLVEVIPVAPTRTEAGSEEGRIYKVSSTHQNAPGVDGGQRGPRCWKRSVLPPQTSLRPQQQENSPPATAVPVRLPCRSGNPGRPGTSISDRALFDILTPKP